MGEQEEESGYGVSQIAVGREVLVSDEGRRTESESESGYSGRRTEEWTRFSILSSAHSKAYFNIPLRSKTLNLKRTIPLLTYVLEKLRMQDQAHPVWSS
ncbi:hypothetical protein K435DRAFT_868995 [Dendrothele bispora CBS 962.96]|uniref:Uncharacterized protein n=1 Tax=Dendrothele bispora (strain CBS 962.96) TaxID=1314807 RepID=A0A4S8LAD8_DENBC|nr:hypothetical protein K435DRAFT_868995 [Dendrothele bispora CBS 962.96]